MPPWSLVAVQRPVQRDQCVRRIGISLDGRSRGAAVASRSADAGPRPCGFPAGRPRTPRPRRLVPPGPGAIVPRVRVCPHRSRSPCDGGRDGMLDGEPWSPPRSCVTSKDDQKMTDLCVLSPTVVLYLYTPYTESALRSGPRRLWSLATALHSVSPSRRAGRLGIVSYRPTVTGVTQQSRVTPQAPIQYPPQIATLATLSSPRRQADRRREGPSFCSPRHAAA